MIPCNAVTRRGTPCKRPTGGSRWCPSHTYRFWDCADCGWNTSGRTGHGHEAYMVLDEVWQQSGLAPDGGRLCVGCLEARLGRTLQPDDFKPGIPMNDFPGATPRLADRQGRSL